MNDLERVRTVLEAHRRAGAPFETAWLRAVAWVHDPQMRCALSATVESWAAAYDGRPSTRGEDAVTILEPAP